MRLLAAFVVCLLLVFVSVSPVSAQGGATRDFGAIIDMTPAPLIAMPLPSTGDPGADVATLLSLGTTLLALARAANAAQNSGAELVEDELEEVQVIEEQADTKKAS